MTALDTYLAADPARCSYGYDLATQHPGLCNCQDGREAGEWSIFRAALAGSVRPDGTVGVNDVRPKVRGRIEAKHIGTLWRRAAAEGLIRHHGWESSTDAIGRNADKQSRVYRWLGS